MIEKLMKKAKEEPRTTVDTTVYKLNVHGDCMYSIPYFVKTVMGFGIFIKIAVFHFDYFRNNDVLNALHLFNSWVSKKEHKVDKIQLYYSRDRDLKAYKPTKTGLTVTPIKMED